MKVLVGQARLAFLMFSGVLRHWYLWTSGSGEIAERKGSLPVVLFLDLGNGVLTQTGVT